MGQEGQPSCRVVVSTLQALSHLPVQLPHFADELQLGPLTLPSAGTVGVCRLRKQELKELRSPRGSKTAPREVAMGSGPRATGTAWSRGGSPWSWASLLLSGRGQRMLR